ncbi:MAG: hypothetical protein O3B08_07125 [Proteobacteria bacterium]|jgi:hypothetical protein|nr:hypothetical protein [Pseudomonadota bacterium]
MPMDQTARQKRFLMEVEQGVRDTNQDVIHQRIPPVTAANFLPFANSVARLRARYLEAAFRFTAKHSDDPINDDEVAELRRHRELYEEARDAFEALRHAIDRGYVDIGDE